MFKTLYKLTAWHVLAWVVTLLLLTSCGQQNLNLTNISGVINNLDFNLVDMHGQKVSGSSYKGFVVLLYFGYINCPDVCPTTLAKLSGVLAKIGEPANDARILFVTVDPERDSLSRLQSYSSAFGKWVIGLRPANHAALERLAKRYRISYGYGEPGQDGEYEVSHSSAVYIFDRDGNARLLSTPSDTPASLVHDLTILLNE